MKGISRKKSYERSNSNRIITDVKKEIEISVNSRYTEEHWRVTGWDFSTLARTSIGRGYTLRDMRTRKKSINDWLVK